jgi:ATP-dependent Clp protease ATP-binding subunit ClpA
MHDHIGSEHLLYGILMENSSFGAEILEKNKISLDTVKQQIIKMNTNFTTDKWTPSQSHATSKR